jgi:hypothetical protein
MLEASFLLSNTMLDCKGFLQTDSSYFLCKLGVVFIRQKMEKLGAPTPEFEGGSAKFIARLWAGPNPNLEKDAVEIAGGTAL